MQIENDLHGFFWFNPTANNANTYFIDGSRRILIDPGHDHLFGHVETELERLGITAADIDVILITHGHPDHIEAVRRFAGGPALIAMHTVELDFIRRMAPRYGQALGVADFAPQILLTEGGLEIGDLSLEVIHAPGHSPGSIALYWPQKKALFTGDVVFQGGIGRTDLPAGDGAQLKQSIQRLAQLDVELLLPGHGDMIRGGEAVADNFREIETFWFGYL
ncbi:MBL fold metallo-hydrolase [Desulfatiglans anilini]|uniref:MBL fold metallo-hydrolase n=1 Tax=Desulfatiglans anilini TaxID=90728 RepID=UPI0003FA6278|nr:MBL fold metallo-hydrolase [Desulfatiglans anilini]